jgi:hypothetical protein
MGSIHPKRLMSLFLVAILLTAVSASGGSLPASLPDTHAPSGKADRSASRRASGTSIKDQANLGLDLGRLGQRVTGGSVYDMFSGAPKPESAPSEQEQIIQKKQQAARRAAKSKTPPSPPISQTPVAPVSDPVPVTPIEPVVEAPPPPPPPIPTPPFPFKYTGSHRPESGQTTYFLTKGNQLYTVEVGDILDTVYSIDGEEEGQLTVTYLPLDRTQTISTGSPQ